MAVFAGPNVIDDGLVLTYDQGNTDKSWKGKPTTNFYTNGHFSGGNGITQEGGSNPTNEIIVFSNPGNSEYVLRQTGTVGFTEYQINLTTQLVASTTYVMSGWYAESLNYSSADGSRMFHSRAFSASEAHVATGNGIGTVLETRIVNGITWRYCYATITTPADYSNSFNWYVGYGPSSYTGNRYYTNLQMEVGTLPSRFVNGTRSNTQAILDLTNQNTITATSLTYPSDGTFSFNGTDYITLPINATFNTASVTYEAWAYLETIDDRHILYVNWAGNALEVNSNRSVVMYNNSSSGGQLGATTSAGVFEWNTWNHFVGVYDDNAQALYTYVNGALLATRTSTPSTTYSVSTHAVSGVAFGGEVRGRIPIVRHYNRALSGAQIRQNFNALRGRFGI
jgi:hypothetical protein